MLARPVGLLAFKRSLPPPPPHLCTQLETKLKCCLLTVEVYYMVVQGMCFCAPYKVIPDAEASILSGGHGKKRKEASACGEFPGSSICRKEISNLESNLALQRRMRFCTADSVDVSFCPVMRCLSIMTCIPSGSVAEKKGQKNYWRSRNHEMSLYTTIWVCYCNHK